MRLVLIYFSPTHSTQTVLRTISKGIDYETVLEVDLTTTEYTDYIPKKDDVIIIGSPVYNGRVPLDAYKRFNLIKGDSNLCVVVSVFGNVSIGKSLIELKTMVEYNGFKVIAGAGFIGEHSFSTDNRRIAYKRPDKYDLVTAKQFGRDIKLKVNKIKDLKTIQSIKIPGKQPKKLPKSFPKMASKATKYCEECGHCITVCPVHAIDEQLKCDSSRCILCKACVKECPNDARTLSNPLLTLTAIGLSQFKDKEPVIYI